MPDFSASYVFAGFAIFMAITVASHYIFREYSGDPSDRALVASFLAGLYGAFIGNWATGIRPYYEVGPDDVMVMKLSFDWIIWSLVGIGLGVCYVIVNFSERPASARSGVQMVAWILLGGTLGVAVYQMWLTKLLELPHPDWIAVAAIGATVGVGELVSRYRDEPAKAVFTLPALLYVALNAAASLLALAATAAASEEAAIGVGQAMHWTPVIGAGLGAMAILRSALFVVRTQDGKDLQVGPGSLVQTLLEAADRSLDRLRAQQRAWTVARVMDRLEILAEPAEAGPASPTGQVPASDDSLGGSDQSGSRGRGLMRTIPLALGGATPQRTVDRQAFAIVVDIVAGALPAYCIALTQNLKDTDQIAFVEGVSNLRTAACMSDRVKLLTIGLIAMNHVGAQVLDAAVTSLADDLRTLARERKRDVEDRLAETEAKSKKVADVTREAAVAAREDDASLTVQELTRRAAELAADAATSAARTNRRVKIAVEELSPTTTMTATAVAEALSPGHHPSTSDTVADTEGEQASAA